MNDVFRRHGNSDPLSTRDVLPLDRDLKVCFPGYFRHKRNTPLASQFHTEFRSYFFWFRNSLKGVEKTLAAGDNHFANILKLSLKVLYLCYWIKNIRHPG